MTVRKNGNVSDKGVAVVGFQRDFWGDDPELAAEMEARFEGAEKRALDVLTELPSRWPLTGDDRGLLAEFLAIHIVRMPSFGGYIRQIGEQANRETIAEGAPKHGFDDAQAAVYAELLRSDRIHADGLLRQIPRVGSMLGSMHWSIVEFPEDWLITCDQPVVMLALIEQSLGLRGLRGAACACTPSLDAAFADGRPPVIAHG